MAKKVFSGFMMRILNNLEEGAYLIDLERKIIFWNRSAERITGFSAEDVLGRTCSDNILNHVDREGHLLCGERCPLMDVMNTKEEQTACVFLHHKEGYRIPVKVHGVPWSYDSGKLEGVLELFTDTSEIRMARRKIDLLHEELYKDTLTRVGNRRYCDKELEHFLDDYRNKQIPFAAAICDLDHFKHINDTYGHEFGDRILKMTAGTLVKALRDEDIVCRWGGEEFMLLLPGVSEEQQIRAVFDRVLIMIGESFLLAGEDKVSVTASFGITLMKRDDGEESLFTRIDSLLYQSKNSGRNRYSIG